MAVMVSMVNFGKRHALVPFLFVLLFISASSQEVPIGGQCPNLVFSHIINGDTTNFDLASLRGKIVLLDFWTSHCLPCVKEMSRLDTLQQKYGSDMRIISISDERGIVARTFLKRRNENHLITILADGESFQNYFPYSVVPHMVWIDKEGKLLATTSDESLTEENISSAIHGETVAWVMKNDIVKYPVSQLLDSKVVRYRSILSPRMEGLNGEGRISYMSNVPNRIICYNEPVTGLYSLAFDQRNIHASRIIIHSKDSAQLTFPRKATAEWLSAHTYCYDLIVDSTLAKDLSKIMVRDIDECFGLKGSIKMIDTTCFVLRRTSKQERYKNHDLTSDAYMPDESGNHQLKFIHNRPLRILIDVMFNMEKNLYVIDETGIKDNVSIEFSAPADDIDGMNKDLERYDLKIFRERRKVPFLVIRDR